MEPVTLIAGAALLFLLLSGGEKGGGTTPPKDGPIVEPPKGPGGGNKPKPGGDKPKPSGGDKPKPPAPKGPKPKGRGYGGGHWGTGNVPASFNWDGNQLWISPNCDTVAEGSYFMPAYPAWQAPDGGGPTLEATLKKKTGPAGSSDPRDLFQVYSFIDYLVNEQGYQQPEDVVAAIFSEVAPMCAAVDPVQWGSALVDWYTSFSERVAEYVESQLTGIDFEPSNED